MLAFGMFIVAFYWSDIRKEQSLKIQKELTVYKCFELWVFE